MTAVKIHGDRPLSKLLRMAVMAGVESAVQIHIDRGDDINARDVRGMTPLMLTAARDKPGVCKLLLSAGADHSLLDPSGRTALDIAVSAGSVDTAAILQALQPTPRPLLHTEVKPGFGPQRSTDTTQPPAVVKTSEATRPITQEATTDAIGQDAPPIQLARALASSAENVVDEWGGDEFDLSGWETEEQQQRPEADTVVLASASAVQIAITTHEPIDSSADWNDIDAYLPDVALPLARADDTEGRARLRLFLLRAIREGSVPALDVQALSTNEDRSANPDAEAYLAMIINDLGAETDERFEYSSAEESFEVFVDAKESPDEEAALDEALVAIDQAASPR